MKVTLFDCPQCHKTLGANHQPSAPTVCPNCQYEFFPASVEQLEVPEEDNSYGLGKSAHQSGESANLIWSFAVWSVIFAAIIAALGLFGGFFGPALAVSGGFISLALFLSLLSAVYRILACLHSIDENIRRKL